MGPPLRHGHGKQVRRQVILAKVVIDATGDGDIAAMAGVRLLPAESDGNAPGDPDIPGVASITRNC